MKRLTTRVSPLVQLTMALVALASTLVILATLFLDVIPDRDGATRQAREAVAEALAVQLAERLAHDDAITIEKTLRHVVTRTPDLRSVGVRRADGELLVDSGGHAGRWQSTDDRSRAEEITVPLHAENGRWGRVELAYAAHDVHPVLGFFRQPLVQMLLFVTVGGWIVFGLYMRRALQHLDPSTVVPERVQGAFDAMAEGVVVLDAKGRVMMCNKAFRALDASLASMHLGEQLAALPWLAAHLPADPSSHAWSRAMSTRSPNAGTALEVGDGDAQRRYVVNAAPISDASGAVRGCMVTFADMTALHRANEALRETMAQLQLSKQEVDHKNAELERLATRDPLTGVMNRRAFQSAFERLAASARDTGQPLACLMIDIDHFKAVNDTHGHGIGDRVIQEVARRLQDSVRGTDLVCRWGGEEFCIVTLGLDVPGAVDFAERVRRRIEREAGAAVREVPGLRVTCSVGVTRSAGADEALDAMIERADQALYDAKRSGRNRVELAAREAPAAVPVPVDHVAPGGWLEPHGWAAACEQLLAQARADDRTLACILTSTNASASSAARRRGDPKVEGADGVADHADAVVARCMLEAAPRRTAVTRLDDGSFAMLVVGWSLDDATGFALELRQRLQDAPAPSAAAAPTVRLSVGIDALPARSPAAWMLQQRAAQALARARRDVAGGVALFAAPPSPSGPREGRSRDAGPRDVPRGVPRGAGPRGSSGTDTSPPGPEVGP